MKNWPCSGRALVFVMASLAVGCGRPGQPEAPDTTAAPPTTADAAPVAADAAPVAADTAPAAADAGQVAPKFLRGKIEMPGDMVLTVNVVITGDTGTLDIPMQGMVKAPITGARLSETEVAFALHPPGAPPEVNVTFAAKKAADSDAYVGELDQLGTKLPLKLVLVASEADFVARRPQTPQPPFPYATELVKVGADHAELACTLSLPPGAGPHPVVAMFTGSGPQDRDETIFEHKPFLVISDAFVRAGIATMRCDDRGVGESTGSLEDADLGVFTADGKAIVAFLAGRQEVDKARIGALGHSEGGIVVADLAKAGVVAFAVTLAGPALSGRAVSVRQNLDAVLAQGVPAAEAAALEKAVDALFGGMAEDLPEAELDVRVKALAEAVVAARKDGPPASVEEVAAGFAPLLDNRWLRSWVKSEPGPTLAAAKVPVLALFGEKDTQVHGPEHSAALKKAFDAAHKDNGQVEMVMGANHLFQRAQTGKLSEYEEIEETIQSAVLDRIVAWVKKQTAR